MANYTVDKIDVNTFFKANNVEIPEYQRSYVWTIDKVKRLIDSLITNKPMGAITVYERIDEHGKTYVIVDGLQRCNTINLFITCPRKLIKFEFIYKLVLPHIEILFAENPNVKRSFIRRELKRWYDGIENATKPRFYETFKDLKDDEIYILEPFWVIFSQKIDFSNYVLPIIIYNGEATELPTIFKYMNLGSKQLNKFEVLASTLSRFDAISTVTTQKYNDMAMAQKKKQLSMDKSSENEWNLFSFIEMLNIYIPSKISDISNVKISLYLDEETKEGAVFKDMSTAFEILATIMFDNPNSISKFEKILLQNKNFRAKEFTESLFNAITNVCEFINNLKIFENIQIRDISRYHFIYLFTTCFRGLYKYEIDKFINTRITSDKLIDELISLKIHSESSVINGTLFYDIEEQVKQKWFKDENRQLTFFMEVFSDTLYAIDNHNVVENISTSDTIYFNLLEGLNFEDENYIYKNKTYKYIKLQFVNNEPENLRIQGNIVKNTLDEGISIFSYFTTDTSIYYVFWDFDILNQYVDLGEQEYLTYVDIIKNIANPSLKINAIKIVQRNSNEFIFDSYKYPAKIIKVSKE